MSIASYSELLTALEAYTDRGDLAAVLPTFVGNVEATLNRRLEDPEMEVLSSTTATGDTTALPSDFGSMVSVSDGVGRPLLPMGSVDFAGIDRSVSGIPRYYTIEDGAITFAPGNSTASIRMVYRRTIPALTSTNTTNWLLTRAPDVYLYGCLFEEAVWERDGEAAAGFQAKFEQAVSEMFADGARRKWGAGPIAPRIRRT